MNATGQSWNTGLREDELISSKDRKTNQHTVQEGWLSLDPKSEIDHRDSVLLDRSGIPRPMNFSAVPGNDLAWLTRYGSWTSLLTRFSHNAAKMTRHIWNVPNERMPSDESMAGDCVFSDGISGKSTAYISA